MENLSNWESFKTAAHLDNVEVDGPKALEFFESDVVKMPGLTVFYTHTTLWTSRLLLPVIIVCWLASNISHMSIGISGWWVVISWAFCYVLRVISVEAACRATVHVAELNENIYNFLMVKKMFTFKGGR